MIVAPSAGEPVQPEMLWNVLPLMLEYEQVPVTPTTVNLPVPVLKFVPMDASATRVWWDMSIVWPRADDGCRRRLASTSACRFGKSLDAIEQPVTPVNVVVVERVYEHGVL